MRVFRRSGIALLATGLGFGWVAAAGAQDQKDQGAQKGDRYDPVMIECVLRYNLKGWSLVYKQMNGEGTISCDNGQTQEVSIKLRSGGFTAGKSEIIGGRGDFSEVRDISELLGSYAHAGAHAGANKSASASVVTKGEVSLALAGSGQGVDLGIDVGAFTIEALDSK